MTGTVGRWTVGVFASVAAHLAVFAGLSVAVRPDPIPDQPMPRSELQVEAYALDRTQARPADPDIAPAQAEQATGQSVASGAIRQSRAAPATLPVTAVVTANPDTQPVQTEPANAANLAAVAPSETSPLSATRPASPQTLVPVASPNQTATVVAMAPDILPPTPPPSAAPVLSAALAKATVTAASPVPGQVLRAGAGPPPQTLTSSAAAAAQKIQTLQRVAPPMPNVAMANVTVAATRPAPGQVLRAEAGPAAQFLASFTLPVTQTIQAIQPVDPPTKPVSGAATPLALGEPTAQLAVLSRPDPDVVPNAPLDALPTPESAPVADRMVAALAFSGDRAGDVDPASLAAFQSFTQPGDLANGTDPLRDGVSGVLGQVPCARLQVGFDPATTTLTVNGHIPENGLRAPVLAALQSQMGADIVVSDNMLILPRPQCGALSGIGSVGLPQSTDQITNPLLIGADTHARVLDFVKDDRLHFDLVAPEYDAWVYVDYFDADGAVLHLSPNETVALTQTPANNTFRVGTETDADTGLKITVGPPYGQEIVVAFAASAPLYDGLRPIIEPAEPYLAWLREQVSAARAKDPGFKGEWVYFFVTTAAR